MGQNGPNPYLGATVGRVANRVNRGSFVIDGNRVQLTVNNGIHHLHGGFVGFDKVNLLIKLRSSQNFGINFKIHFVAKLVLQCTR